MFILQTTVSLKNLKNYLSKCNIFQRLWKAAGPIPMLSSSLYTWVLSHMCKTKAVPIIHVVFLPSSLTSQRNPLPAQHQLPSHTFPTYPSLLSDANALGFVV